MSTITLDIVARDFASGTMSKVGLSAGGLAKSVAGLAGAAVVGGIAKSINLAKDFDLTLRQVGVQTGQTGAGLKSLSDLAMKMGADTTFSAKDAANAMLELAKGGLTAAQIRAGALSTTMQLAAAGGLDLGNAATYVTQGMNTFGLSAQQANQVSVALAGGANASTASVESLGQALSQVGPGAKNAGLSLQETVAALAAFDNAGIKGSDAGTSLKTMLQRLIPTTAQAKGTMRELGLSFVDGKGRIDGLATVAQKLQNKLRPLSQEQRILALQTIFGSDATRAATVLMNEGAAGVQRYVRAASDQSTVQKMANTSMEGASGAWEAFTGSVETAGIQIGTKLLPAFTDLANMGADAINEVMTWGPGLRDTFGPTVSLAGDLLGVVKPLASGVGTLAGAFGSLPGPLKSVVVQAGLAALIVPRLSSAFSLMPTRIGLAALSVRDFGTQLRNAETRGAAIQGALGRIGVTARNAAGVGGMLLLAQSAQHTSSTMGKLGTIAGGAAVGFSMGGPWGAAIGGLGGAFVGLRHKTEGVGEAFRVTKGDGDTLRSTLNQITGATSEATRKFIGLKLEKAKVLDAARTAGVSQRTLIDASLGRPEAIDQVRTAVRSLTGQLTRSKSEWESYKASQEAYGGGPSTKKINEVEDGFKRQQHVIDALKSTYGAFGAEVSKAQREQQESYYSTAKLSTLLKGFPKGVSTDIKTNGVPQSMGQVAALAQRYRLTPKQILTVARMGNVAITTKQAQAMAASLTRSGQQARQGMNSNLRQAGAVKPNTAPFTTGMRAAMNAGRTTAAQGAASTRSSLSKAGNVKPNMSPFVGGIRSGIAAGRAAAGGSTSIGSAMKSGVMAGFSGFASSLAASAASGVRAAIAAAKAAAAIKSPSRKMRDEVGKPLGQGAVQGLKSTYTRLSASGAGVIAAVVTGVRSGYVPLQTAIKQISAYVSQQQAKLQSLAEARAQVISQVAGSGSSIFSDLGDGPVSVGSLLAAQSQKAASASQLQRDMQAAIGKGLSKALVTQLANAGSSGSSALHALALGSSAAIAQLNSLDAATTASLAAAGATAGSSFNADIASQQAVVNQAGALAKALKAAGVGGATVSIHLEDEVIIRSIRRYSKKRGKKSPV